MSMLQEAGIVALLNSSVVQEKSAGEWSLIMHDSMFPKNNQMQAIKWEIYTTNNMREVKPERSFYLFLEYLERAQCMKYFKGIVSLKMWMNLNTLSQ